MRIPCTHVHVFSVYFVHKKARSQPIHPTHPHPKEATSAEQKEIPHINGLPASEDPHKIQSTRALACRPNLGLIHIHVALGQCRTCMRKFPGNRPQILDTCACFFVTSYLIATHRLYYTVCMQNPGIDSDPRSTRWKATNGRRLPTRYTYADMRGKSVTCIVVWHS